MSSIGAGEASCLKYLLDISQRQDRTAPFDALLTSWWAYQRPPDGSAVLWDIWAANQRLAASRNMLGSVHYISVAASSALRRAKRTVVRDLVVPTSAIRRITFAQQLATIDDVRATLKRWYRLALITDEEAERLREAGLARRMPDGWHEGCDLAARYNALSILVQEVGECVAYRAAAREVLKAGPTQQAGRATSLAWLLGSAATLAVRP